MHEIDRVEMEDAYVDPRQPRKKSGITYKHHYEVDCFNDVIDWLVQELDSRFSVTSCLFDRPLSVQGTRFMISMWRL